MDTGQGHSGRASGAHLRSFLYYERAEEGTGLGLSISYGIVHEHEGLIEVDSTVGSGTRFRLEFPGLAVRRARAVSAPAAEALPA